MRNRNYLLQNRFSPFKPEKEHCLMYTQACIDALADQLTHLGRLVVASTQWAHPIRGPLSLHLPLCRHAACFLCLAVFTHRADVRQLMKPFLEPNPNVLRRLMEELANVLVRKALFLVFIFIMLRRFYDLICAWVVFTA